MPGKSAAGIHGASLEQFVVKPVSDAGCALLDQHGRKLLRQSSLATLPSINMGRPYFATHIAIPYITSIYGVPWVLDMFIWHPVKFRRGLVLECKWQQGSGSADDKMPFSVLSLSHIRDDGLAEVAALMMEAHGMRECVKIWVRRQCKDKGIELFESTSHWAGWIKNNL